VSPLYHFGEAPSFGTVCVRRGIIPGMADGVIRPYRPGDEGVVVSLWNAILDRDPITAAAFAERTLGDVNFTPAGILIAEAGGKPVGFAVSVPPGITHRFAPAAGTGRIAGLGVLPELRRRGTGGRLLDAALAFLVERGCRKVVYAAHEYYTAGLDRAYAPGLALLASRGFKESYEAVAMGRLLYDYERPPEIRALEEQLAAEGVTAAPYTSADRPALAAFFAAEFPDWAAFLADKERRGDPPGDIVIARLGNTVIGFCQRLEADHVGPFGIAASWRNRGIGTIMLYRLLDGMRAQGYRYCWFGETGRAQPYYERAGFFVTRRYAIMARTT